MIGEYNTRQQSTHVTRDRVSGDKRLENLLDQWGYWRRTGATVLSFDARSCVVDIAERMANNKNYTYESSKYDEIVLNYEKQGLTGDALKEAAKRAFYEYRRRMEELSQPKETVVQLSAVPVYHSKKDMAQADRAIAELYNLYRRVLIQKYEHEWTSADFLKEWRWDVDKTKDKLRRSRDAARYHKKIAVLLGRA